MSPASSSSWEAIICNSSELYDKKLCALLYYKMRHIDVEMFSCGRGSQICAYDWDASVPRLECFYEWSKGV